MKIGKKKYPIPSYEESFRACTTHVLIEKETEPADRIRAVHAAIRTGRCYFVYDCIGAIHVEFETDSGTVMGSQARLGEVIQARCSDDSAILRVFCNGVIVAAGRGEICYQPTKPGAYRLEVNRVGSQRGPLFFGARPWAFTNPIYFI
jgi:hypothetical protein